MGTETKREEGGERLADPDFESVRLALARLRYHDSLRATFCDLASIAANALDVDRVGLWLLVDEGRAIFCRYLFQHSSGELFEGAVLRAEEFPTYFRALSAMRAIPAEDARTDPRTHELRAAYLDPLGVTAMLDAPVYRAGELAGVICHESLDGKPRVWTRSEYDLAATVADTAARLLEEAARYRAEATLASSEAQLIELRRFETVGQFAAGAAHDFRAILRSVLGFSALILEAPDDRELVADYARRIQEAAARGEALTSDLISFGKDDRSAPRVLDVAALIEALAPTLQLMVEPPRELDLHTSKPVSRVLIDASQLERAIINLVGNARDALTGPGRIRVELDEESPAGLDGATYVVITVADEGVGIPPHVRERMFEPFFSTKAGSGTGLGLTIVSQTAARAGGFTRVQSEPGRGTTIRLYLPRIARSDAGATP